MGVTSRSIDRTKIDDIERMAKEIRDEFGVKIFVNSARKEIRFPEVPNTVRLCPTIDAVLNDLSMIHEGMHYLQYCQTYTDQTRRT